eukprot:Protomagalhaensia_sp_Gyna_25__5499@NODE_733_length_2736_cov_53_536522_g572_i0_p2_GENE_NODE_733_length_2736_cov_53_536522_g572_i0NODE_733_length_2736_cov_53_536522_g572_i0_p2_ORF_typecomplete_len216_score19_29_NODE_733_length_2736_cov_53_536522_g572_i03791026
MQAAMQSPNRPVQATIFRRKPGKILVYGKTNVRLNATDPLSLSPGGTTQEMGKPRKGYRECPVKKATGSWFGQGRYGRSGQTHAQIECQFQSLIASADFADEPCAPQNYLGGMLMCGRYCRVQTVLFVDWELFPQQPSQTQLLFAGNDLMPIPRSQVIRQMNMSQLESLSHTTFVRKFHVPPQEIESQVRERYWGKHMKKEAGAGETELNGVSTQ